MTKIFLRFWIWAAALGLGSVALHYWFNFLVEHIEASVLGTFIFFLPFVIATLAFGAWYDYIDNK